MPTNFQKYLDQNALLSKEVWQKELSNLDLTGDFHLEDADKFFDSITKKSVAHWAVGEEITTRHEALKRIIESV